MRRFRGVVVPFFDNPDYGNDFSLWTKLHPGDRMLAEQYGIMSLFTCVDC
jgi:hypothetical protein